MKSSLKIIFIALLGFGASFLIFKFVAPLLTPFIVAVFISLAMEPLVRIFTNKFGMSRGRSVLMAMAFFILGLFLVTGLIFRRLIIELIELSAALPGVSKDLWQAMINIQDKFFLSLPEPIINNYPKISEAFQANINSLISKLQVVTTNLLNSLINTITGVTGIFLIIVVAIIASYFFSRDRNSIVRFWVSIIPEPWGRKSLEVVQEIFRAMVGYIKAQLFLISMTMVLTIIGLYFIGARYALLMGIVIGFFDLLPVLGPGTVYIPWIIYSFLKGETTYGLMLGILYIIIMVIRQIVETKVVSRNIGLHPLATLIAMYVGLQLMGVAGLIVGPLFIIAVKAIAKAANITIVK